MMKSLAMVMEILEKKFLVIPVRISTNLGDQLGFDN